MSNDTFPLSDRDYYEKAYGGWLGKNIGGTLGAPVEGKKELLHLDFYPVQPDGPLENDDLDLQLVWLHALEQYGARLTSRELSREWLDHVFFPFDEYGYALTNLRLGLKPPLSGSFNNPFNDCMGSPIRSEMWAMVAPGQPLVAAYYAYQDAVVDHAGGEGVFGEMFFAAIQSAAFLESDRDKLIETGLSCIPESCRTAKAVKDLLMWHRQGLSWTETRELILHRHGSDNFTDAPQNIAFTLLGWLYGEDFEDAILKAVNCGYDTDCTAATLAATLGIIGGRESLPERWVTPVGEKVVVSPPIKGFPAPANLDELTRRTMKAGKEVFAVWLGREDLKQQIEGIWQSDHRKEVILLPQGSKEAANLELHIDYGKEGPSIGVRQRKTLRFTIANRSSVLWNGAVELLVPSGWQGHDTINLSLKPGEKAAWSVEVQSGDSLQSSFELVLDVQRRHDESPWYGEKVSFFLAGSAHWRLTAPQSGRTVDGVAQGSRIPFAELLQTEEEGVYKAESILHNPRQREMKLIVATPTPVTVRLNGQVVLEDAEEAEWMPAYHRSPKSREAVLNLPKGEHALKVEVLKKSGELKVLVLPVAVHQTKEPGPNYYLTDVLFKPC